MTAKLAGKSVVEGFWLSLYQLRQRWVLLVFLAGTLYWVRETYEEFARLPTLMRQQTVELMALEDTVARLEANVVRRLQGDHSPVLGFPGKRHSIDDGAPGTWTILRWRPVKRLRADCVPSGIDAWMIDRNGHWFSVATAVTPIPALEEEADLAFGVRVHSMMSSGRAQILVQVTFDCGTHRQVETAPWLQFNVLEN